MRGEERERPVAEMRNGELFLPRETVVEAGEEVPRGESALGRRDRSDRPVSVLSGTRQGDRERGPLIREKRHDAEVAGPCRGERLAREDEIRGGRV